MNGKHLVGLPPGGAPYIDHGGLRCYELELPALLTGKAAADLSIPPDRCLVLSGPPGHVVTPDGARTLAHRVTGRVPLVMLGCEPMAAALIERAVRDVLAWLAAGSAA